MNRTRQAIHDMRELLIGRGLYVVTTTGHPELQTVLAETTMHLDGDYLTRICESLVGDEVSLAAHHEQVADRLMAIHETAMALRRSLPAVVFVAWFAQTSWHLYQHHQWLPVVRDSVISAATAWAVYKIARPVGFWVVQKWFKHRFHRVAKEPGSARRSESPT